MKRNILIKIISLLLCVSNFTLTVTAAPPLPKEYPAVWISTPYGLRTNEMLYVDQFFKHNGDYSDTGNALLHWLNMTPKSEKDALREDSGYLTLEQEIDGRSGIKYGVNKGVNVITGIPAAVYDWVFDNDETDYEEMFPNAGEDAVIYYQTFQQIYLEYKKAVIEGIVESEVILDLVSDTLGKLDEYGGELICATSTKTSAYIIANTQKKANFNAEAADLLDVRSLENGSVEWKILYKDGKTDWYSPLEVTDACRRGEKSLVLNDRTGKTPETVQSIINDGLEQMSAGKGHRKNIGAKDISCETLSDLAEGVEKADGYDNLSAQHKKAAKTTKEQVQESAKKQKELAAEHWNNNMSHIVDLLGVGLDTYFYWKDYSNMTALQAGYMNALFNTSYEYYDMLTRWRNSLEVTDTVESDETCVAMQDALDRVRADIAVTYYETQETIKEVIAGETFILTAEERNAVMVSGIGTILGIVADEIKLAVKAAKSTITASSTGAVGSSVATGVVAKVGAIVTPIAWAAALCWSNIKTGERLAFADSATAITNLKWSLYALITEEGNGLLAQYANNPSHETACSIIEALKTMAVAKYNGENLVREYYLDDLYDELGINPGSSLHTVLWNELQTNSARLLPDIKEVTEPVIVVYEEDVKIVVDGDDQKITRVLGVFSKSATSQASFAGQPLKTIDSEPRFRNLQAKDPDTYAGMDFETWSSGWQPNGQNAKNRFTSQRAYLYSRNGLDLVITDNEYQKYLDIRDNLADLTKRNDYNDPELSKAERLNADRLWWTWECQQWIESFEMYNPSTDYSTHKVRHGIVPN